VIRDFVRCLPLTLILAGCSPDAAAPATSAADSGTDYCAADADARAPVASWKPPGLAALVDPLIGTDGPGNVVPGALVPHGMVKLSPDTDVPAGDIQGYEYGNTKLQGFSHTHLEGPGGSNYGYSELLLLPQTGPLEIDPTKSPTAFSHASEIVTPAYYAVTLDDAHVRVELAATAHGGLHRYTFDRCGGSRVLVDIGHTRGKSVDGEIDVIGDDTLEGFGAYTVHPLLATALIGDAPQTGLAKVYFSIRTSRPFTSFGTWSGGTPAPGAPQATGAASGAWVEFGERSGRVVEARVGVSFISVEQARKNREAELDGKTLEDVRDAAVAEWNQHLGRIEVEGGTADERTMFYTALFHALMQPADYTEDGKAFVGGGGAVVDTGAHHYYADDWCAWDTARGTQPLVTLLDPEVKADMMQSYVTWYEHAGWMGKCSWHALGDSRVMTANMLFCSIADATTKKLDDFDVKTAYAAMKKGSMQDSANPAEQGLCGFLDQGTPPDYVKLGYVSTECDAMQGASMTLEYAYNDFCTARVAEGLGNAADAAFFDARSKSWKNVWNPAHGFFQPRHRDGSWVEPFDMTSQNKGFTESDPWQYLFTVPHDLCGLVTTFGGAKAFEGRLDAMFDGGHFDPSNEPDFHVPYLYGVVGAPAKAVTRLRGVVKSSFSAKPGGLAGNDDAGATSAWLAFALMGFYPVTPGEGSYWLASPHFDRVTLHVDPAKKVDFVIDAKGAGSAQYVQAATLGGKALAEARFTYADVMAGKTLTLTMGAAPSSWATAPVCP
jgi:predicted alpha-1,2-mannosidase